MAFVVGPSGGLGGGAFSDLDALGSSLGSGKSRVGRIEIRHGALIDAVQITHVLNDGSLRTLGQHGGTGGGLATIDMRKDEVVIAISGRYGAFVDSLTIRTNQGRVLKFGGDGGSVAYNYTAPPGFAIIGFVGSSGTLIDAIGAIIEPTP
jgi:Jacalin-like lectin domain